MRPGLAGAAVLAALATAPIASRSAYPPHTVDPDWPCQQIRIAELQPGAFWAGPPLDEAMQTWGKDQRVAALATRVSARRVPLDQAKAEIDEFAKQAGADRQKRLLELFAGIFETLNAERAGIVAGLQRFGARQKTLAEEIRADEDALRALQDDPRSDLKNLGDLTSKLSWETQIYKDRQASIAIACDLPNKVEQRLFDLARVIQDELH